MSKARILADYVAGGTTAAEFDYLDGVTSNIQNQFTAKAPLASPAFTGTPTGITAAHITSGALPVGVTGGSGLNASNVGCTLADIWRVHTTWGTAEADPVVNFEQADSAWDGKIGTMAETSSNSGIFTFPSTGIYSVLWRAAPVSATLQRHIQTGIKSTLDYSTGPTWSTAAVTDITISTPLSSNHHQGMHTCHVIIDVEDVAEVKVKFFTGAGPYYNAASTYNYAYAQFIRYGDR